MFWKVRLKKSCCHFITPQFHNPNYCHLIAKGKSGLLFFLLQHSMKFLWNLKNQKTTLSHLNSTLLLSFNSWREKYSSKEARGLLSFLLQRFSDGKQRGWWWLLRWYTAGPNLKNPPKIKFEKIMKLTDHTCACNDLTSFECESQAPENGSYVNLQKLPWKNSWTNLCFRGFFTFGITV